MNDSDQQELDALREAFDMSDDNLKVHMLMGLVATGQHESATLLLERYPVFQVDARPRADGEVMPRRKRVNLDTLLSAFLIERDLIASDKVSTSEMLEAMLNMVFTDTNDDAWTLIKENGHYVQKCYTDPNKTRCMDVDAEYVREWVKMIYQQYLHTKWRGALT